MKLRGLVPSSFIHVSVIRFIYSHDRSAYFAAGKLDDQSWQPGRSRDKASGSRVEIQSLPTLYPAVHPFHPIPLYPLG
jgi:hypothetical protein